MRKLRILVADDHELVRQCIRRFFPARLGWKVVAETVNGRDAIAKAGELKPDVVIMDIGMPVMDGLQAARQIRDSDLDIQIVVLTMHESDQMISRVFEAGACSYVSKSDLARSLVKAVKDAAEGKLFMTPRVSEIVLEGGVAIQKVSPRGESR
jgi:DNA-binding NarL/FixJ family response regulator